ncbi:nuclear transport factor 2 family protein [Nocardia otitidiscaviarum]|uniref:Nuclear transport factor 2 family protein n=2 Tax=Nocardia otitidiscaviarum TaxID=1823 RepID=A0A516NMR1_9NOCA|nr:nuclear transport factor 2 family protein [Nocardia otitidiscaviarum]
MRKPRWSHGRVRPSVAGMTAQQQTNRELVQRVFARMAAGDTRALTEAMADDVAWTFPGDWSWSGTWSPKTVVLRELLRPLLAQFTDYRMTADLVLADGDRVVVQARGHGTTVRGDAYEQTYCLILRLADGLITEIVEHCDTALVERTLVRP